MTTILIVEDDPTMRTLMAFGLARQGFRAVEAEDGVDALAMLHAHAEIQAVTLDIMMPRLGGFETLRAIRDQWPEMPVVMVSAFNDDKNRTRAMQHAVDILKKPVSAEVLADKLRQLIGARET